MLGLVLEGGGARGAYEIGAVRALFEKGYKLHERVLRAAKVSVTF